MVFDKIRQIFSSEAKLTNINGFQIASISLQGDRNYNEDSLLISPLEQGLVVVVADGLGGHGGGDLASRYFCKNIIELAQDKVEGLKTRPKQTLAELITDSAEKMAKSILEMNPRSDAHTTCVVAYINSESIVVGHIGDSRAILVDTQSTKWRSRDHSVVQMLFDDGEISENEMGNHPDQGRLTKAISLNNCPKASIKCYSKLQKQQALVLCTDGFWEMILASEMYTFASANTLTAKLIEKKAKLAIKRAKGKSDNVSLCVIKY